MDKKPVYRHTGEYASSHDEIDAYIASRRANEACRDAINDAISKHYDGYRLEREAAQEVVSAFGQERTEYLLAIYIRVYEQDGRMGRDNISWAKNIPVAEESSNSYLLMNRCSPGLINLFTKMVRDEALIAQAPPIYKGDAAHAREHGKLQQYRDSNRLNTLCKEAVEKAISANWDGTQIAPDAAKGVIKRFGPKRVAYVLACSVKRNDWDERYSGASREWADTIPAYGSKDQLDDFAVSNHPAKVEAFIRIARPDLQKQRRPSVRKKIKEQPDAPDAPKPPAKTRAKRQER